MSMFGCDAGISFTPTVQNAAYSAGNVMGGLQTINAFLDDANPAGIVRQFVIASKGGNIVAMTVYVFDTNPVNSTFTDKSALVLAASDLAKLAFAPFIITPAVAAGTTAAIAESVAVHSIRNQDAPPTVKLYIAIVANATVTPATTTDLVCKLSLSQD